MQPAQYGRRPDRLQCRLVSAVILLGLSLLYQASPALARAPTTVHDRVEGHFSDPDFCGSGIAVTVDVHGVQTVRFDGEDVQGTGQVQVVLTNPETAASVVVSSAGQVRDQVVSDDSEGVHTHLVTFSGLPEKIQTAGGEVLLRDAGLIAFADTFDDHQLLSRDVVLNRGPHPEADADFALFCTTIVAALR